MLDIFLCISSVIALLLFNRISVAEQNNNCKDSFIIDSIFGRSKYLESKSDAILKGIGDFIHFFCLFHTINHEIYTEHINLKKFPFILTSSILCTVNNVACSNTTTIDSECSVSRGILIINYILGNEQTNIFRFCSNLSHHYCHFDCSYQLNICISNGMD